MQRVNAIMQTLALGLTATAVAAVPPIADDGFANGPLADLHGSNGGTGWTSAWSDVTGDLVTKIAGPGLEWPGLETERGGAVTPWAPGVYPMTGYWRSFGATGTSQFFVSFLLRDDTGESGWGGLKFGTYPTAMIVGVPPGMYAFGLMLSEGLGDIANADLVTGETYLVVVKITKGASGPTNYALYLNPVVGAGEPAFPLASYAGGAGLPTALTLENGGGFTTDEIRVGLTWESVLPVPSCPSDITGDGVVSGADITMVLGGWGTASPDLTGDGIVNGADIAMVLGAWGPCP